MKRQWKKILSNIPGYDPFRGVDEKYYFDEDSAQLALDFFAECLKHVKGEYAGQPFLLQDWEKAIVSNLFGWKRKEDGTRRYREAFIYIPRKNGKTSLVAGLVLYVLFCDGEPGAEIYSCAADREQASLVFDIAAGMVRSEPELRKRATVYKKSIVLNDNSGFYKPISADAHTKHGFNVHCAVMDELHAQPNRELFDTMSTATGSRLQPLIISITTADYSRPSICNEKLKYAKSVRDGVFEDHSFLPVIYEADAEKDDWGDKEVWKRVNPNLGVSLKLDYLEREYKRALESPEYENTFKRLHLNMKTEQAVRWISLERWDKCEDKDFNVSELEGEVCFAGLDLSSTIDITALVLFFPDKGNAVLPFFWIPEENAEKRERRDKVPYQTWANQGYIYMTPGNVVDYQFIKQKIIELGEKYQIRKIAYDPWNSRHLALELRDEEGFDVVEFRQGFLSMNEPCKRFEAMVLSQGLRHDGNPVLRWMAGNVTIARDPAGNIKPDKRKSSEKIDGIVALVMALGLSLEEPVVAGTSGKSIYEERGILTL